MSNEHRKYLAERHGDLAIVVVHDYDEIAQRVEAIGRLRGPVDWGPDADPWSARRLAISLVTDALRDRPDARSLAVALAPRLREELDLDPRGWELTAFSIAHWAMEQRAILAGPTEDPA